MNRLLNLVDWGYTVLVLLLSALLLLLLMIYNLFKYGPIVVYRWSRRALQKAPGVPQTSPVHSNTEQ